LAKVKQEINKLETRGGTHMENGYIHTVSLMKKKAKSCSPEEWESRIFFLTDDNPTSSSGLGLPKMAADAAEYNLYSTFVGIGLDFTPNIAEELSKVMGSYYFVVRTQEQFLKKLSEEFEYMVTPLVFGVKMTFQSEQFTITGSYGIPPVDEQKENKEHTKDLLKIGTLFPSPKDASGRTKGGVVLLRLALKDGVNVPDLEEGKYDGAYPTHPKDPTIILTVNYTDRNKKAYHTSDTIKPPVHIKQGLSYYAHNGIRKAALLVRLGTVYKEWIEDQNRPKKQSPHLMLTKGVMAGYKGLTPNSTLTMALPSPPLLEVLTQFKTYYNREREEQDDKDLEQEDKLLDKIIAGKK